MQEGTELIQWENLMRKTKNISDQRMRSQNLNFTLSQVKKHSTDDTCVDMA